MTYTPRRVTRHALPIGANVPLPHPQSAVLCFGAELSLDIGAYCYLHRSPAPRKACSPNLGREVDPSSLDTTRIEHIRRVISFLSDKIAQGGARPATVFVLARDASVFLDWADGESYSYVLGSDDLAREAFSRYVDHLRDLANRNVISANTAAGTQFQVLAFLSEFLRIDNLSHGVRMLAISKHSTVATVPAGDDNQSAVLELCDALFEGLSNLVLNRLPYPFLLSVPAHLAIADGGLWVFPCVKWTMSRHEYLNRASLKYGYWAYDYANGRISQVNDIFDHYACADRRGRREHARTAIKGATTLLRSANNDPQSKYRLIAALNAHNAFVIMFMAHTGMNWATIQDLTWANDADVGAERQGFRTIKWRASGRIVSFEIQAVFLQKFKRFLQLRAYLLNGAPISHLFLTCELPQRSFGRLKAKSQSNFFGMLRRLDPKLPKIMSKQWRASKSDWLLRHTDAATTAAILQNSEATTLRSYAAGSETTQLSDFTKFFRSVRDTVISRNAQVTQGEECAVGECSARGNPKPIAPSAFTPSCTNSEGCLFCDNIRVHADERDTRKLLSCRHCLQLAGRLASSEEQFHQVFDPIFHRITSLLAEIERRESGLVEKVRVEVEQHGELDPYWAGKYQLLANLGLAP